MQPGHLPKQEYNDNKKLLNLKRLNDIKKHKYVFYGKDAYDVNLFKIRKQLSPQRGDIEHLQKQVINNEVEMLGFKNTN